MRTFVNFTKFYRGLVIIKLNNFGEIHTVTANIHLVSSVYSAPPVLIMVHARAPRVNIVIRDAFTVLPR